MLKSLILILMGGVLINNYVLNQFLGICPFLGVSKKVNQATGMGMAVIFVTKMENGEKSTKGLCLKCAKEMGVPVDNLVGNVMGQFGISPEQLEGAEDDINAMLANTETPSDADDNEDGGAPAIDLPKLFRDAGLFAQKPDGGVPDASKQNANDKKTDKKKTKEEKKLK
mgnify:CR=1 FL=1